LILHKISGQLCTFSEGGELTERRIKTTRASFDEVFAGRPRARILVEASTESEWVACHLEQLGHEVVAAVSNFAPMYATAAVRSGPTGATPALWAKPASSGHTAPLTARQRSSATSARNLPSAR